MSSLRSWLDLESTVSKMKFVSVESLDRVSFQIVSNYFLGVEGESDFEIKKNGFLESSIRIKVSLYIFNDYFATWIELIFANREISIGSSIRRWYDRDLASGIEKNVVSLFSKIWNRISPLCPFWSRQLSFPVIQFVRSRFQSLSKLLFRFLSIIIISLISVNDIMIYLLQSPLCISFFLVIDSYDLKFRVISSIFIVLMKWLMHLEWISIRFARPKSRYHIRTEIDINIVFDLRSELLLSFLKSMDGFPMGTIKSISIRNLHLDLLNILSRWLIKIETRDKTNLFLFSNDNTYVLISRFGTRHSCRHLASSSSWASDYGWDSVGSCKTCDDDLLKSRRFHPRSGKRNMINFTFLFVHECQIVLS